MKKLYLLFPLLLFVFIGFCFSQDVTIAVFDFENNGLEQSEVRILTDELQSKLVQVGGYKVVERRKIDNILKEQKYQMSGCVDECMIEIGNTLGARQIITGNIGKLGKKYNVIANLIDVETGGFIRSSSYNTDGDISLLLEGMSQIAYELTDSTPPISATEYKVSIGKIYIAEKDFNRSVFGNSLHIAIIVYEDQKKVIQVGGRSRGLIGINKSIRLSFKPNSVYKILIRETDGIITKPVSYIYTSKNGEWPFDKKKISFGKGSYIEVSQDPPFPVDDTKYPIYRFLHKTINEHFYTKSSNPKGSWIAEGVEFYAYNEQVEGTVPIYRFLHNSYKDHFYTRNSNPDGNWKKQGVEFYAYPTSVEGTVPIYRYYSKSNRDHFYTTESSLEGDWIEQGIEFYAFPNTEK
jgi:TolB-like protein|tara:strand:- start:5529 stop:6749 length:1221 start_codon:yes stop_codon:yes gene_type:complete